MKAVIYHQYGEAKVLKVADVPNPEIKDKEMLVEISHSSVNPVDWKIRNGSLSIVSGKKFPKRTGSDFSGTITEVGKDIINFNVGDSVYGMISPLGAIGACQEFINVKESKVCKKPENLSFAEASAVPLAGLTAYQGLKNMGRIKSGLKVLITGCTGGVGSMAVQIAKSFDCKITGVCSTKNTEFARLLGCDEVINYDKEDPSSKLNTFDIIYDCSAKLPFGKAKKALKKKGRYITTLPNPYIIFIAPFQNMISSKKCHKIMAKMNPTDLNYLSDLISRNKLKPHIQREYPMTDIIQAQEESETEHVVGKIVVKVKSTQ